MISAYDIAVIGGGHAGIEAANIASQFNLKVALITIPEIKIASPPCNPAIGGTAKGHVVREVDVLGGLIGFLADKAGIQYRVLNGSKGNAVHSTRVQIDKDIYSEEAHNYLSKINNLDIIKSVVQKIEKKSDFIIQTSEGKITSKKVIITVGTFLDGLLHFGKIKKEGGRIDSEKTKSLSEIMPNITLRKMRFKTGTPPRIFKSSIDFTKLIQQKSDSRVRNFHLIHKPFERFNDQVDCFLAKTNSDAMKVIRDNLNLSPMFDGTIKSTGIRYCPSIEDKAHRYPDRDLHHIFIEPENVTKETYYPSGISSSMPEEVQLAFVKKIEGLENAEFKSPGYAVEYDVIDTTQLDETLEVKNVEGLYFAGQVNGTSGYEEAAGQGIVAGANASLKLLNLKELRLSREDSYIGVMIQDLVSNVRDEPYRLFTSRAENRLFIREDNTVYRLGPYRKSFLLKNEIDKKIDLIMEEYFILKDLIDDIKFIRPKTIIDKYSKDKSVNENNALTLKQLLKQPSIDLIKVLESEVNKKDLLFAYDSLLMAGLDVKYEGYICREVELRDKIVKYESTKIKWEELSESKNISFECRLRIKNIKPVTFGQLKQIEGIRPATIAYVASSIK